MLRSFGPWVLVAGAVAISSCVFPGDPPTGVELSWRFPEQFGQASDEAPPIRTCFGALVDEVEVTVRDRDAPEREQTTTYACKAGFYGFEAPFVGTTSVFYELRPGAYSVDFGFYEGFEADGSRREVHTQTAEMDVNAKGIAPVAFDISLEGAMWEVALANPDACQSARFWLEHASEDNLVASEDPAGGAYGNELESQHGLPLDGREQACSNLVAGVHQLLSDRGQYTLHLEVDGQICQRPVTVASDDGLQTTIDLLHPCS